MCIRHCFLPAGYALRMHRRRLTCVQSVPSAHQTLPKCSLARTRLSPLTTCLARILPRLRSTKCAQRSLLKGEWVLLGPMLPAVLWFFVQWQLMVLCLVQNLCPVTKAHVRTYVRTYSCFWCCLCVHLSACCQPTSVNPIYVHLTLSSPCVMFSENFLHLSTILWCVYKNLLYTVCLVCFSVSLTPDTWAAATATQSF